MHYYSVGRWRYVTFGLLLRSGDSLEWKQSLDGAAVWSEFSCELLVLLRLGSFFFQDNRRHLWDSSGKCPMNTLKIWIALHAEKKTSWKLQDWHRHRDRTLRVRSDEGPIPGLAPEPAGSDQKSVVRTQLGSGASFGSQFPKIWHLWGQPHFWPSGAPFGAWLHRKLLYVWTQLTWGPGYMYLHDLFFMQILDCWPISFNQNHRKWSDLHEDDYAYNVIDLQPHNSQQVIKHEFNVILCFNDNFPSDYSKKFTFDHVSVLNVSVKHLTCVHEEKGALSNKKCTL